MMNDNSSASDKMSFGVGKGIRELFSVDVNMVIELFDKDGNLKQQELVHNAMTAAGKAGIADQILAAPTLAKAGWIAVGTGSPAATLLGAEIARVALASKTRSTNAVTMVVTFNAGVATGAITEAGIFDVVTANTVNLWASASFPVINVGASDSLQISWVITIN